MRRYWTLNSMTGVLIGNEVDIQGEGRVTMAAETGGRDYEPASASDCWSRRQRGDILSWSLGREPGPQGRGSRTSPFRNCEKMRLRPLSHLVCGTSLEQPRGRALSCLISVSSAPGTDIPRAVTLQASGGVTQRASPTRSLYCTGPRAAGGRDPGSALRIARRGMAAAAPGVGGAGQLMPT